MRRKLKMNEKQKPVTDSYRENWNKIFGKTKEKESKESKET